MDLLINDKVSAQISGDGPTLVLLHSLAGRRSSFDRIVPRLSTRFRVVVAGTSGIRRLAGGAGRAGRRGRRDGRRGGARLR